MITDKEHSLPEDAPQDSSFVDFVAGTQERFLGLAGPLFETDATGLFEAYLDASSDPAQRQRRNCECCRKFIDRFGGLVTVGDDGRLVPALWTPDGVPSPYRAAVDALRRKVSAASIVMPFLTSAPVLGTVEKGGWRHFAVKPVKPFAGNGLLDARQVAKAKRVAFDSVLRALDEYSAATCQTALRLLKDDTLANSEAALGQAQFLVGLHAARATASGRQAKDNVVFRMVATAPEGFCHPRSSMIATLLDDIAAGMPFEEAARSWAAKMHPLRYLRPQAAPTEGAIRAAEAAFEKLGAGTALQRRFATMADIQETIWRPRAKKHAAGDSTAKSSLFGSLVAKTKPAQASIMVAPPVVMALEKFRRTVLPTADRIEMARPGGRTTFVALTTAVHADARPIYQWDKESKRNPVAWYIYHGGSMAEEFNLSGQHYEVLALTLPPHAWNGEVHPQQGEAVILILENARDLRYSTGSSAIFPSCLKGEFHGFRSTIEAYSNTHPLAGFGEDNAAGLVFTKGEAYDVTLRVTSGGQVGEYRIDRWD